MALLEKTLASLELLFNQQGLHDFRLEVSVADP